MSHLVHVSTSVSKLGASIPTVNLPPIVTCRPNAPCAKCTAEGGGCYALKGHFTLPNVKKSLNENLLAYKENPKLYFSMIAESFKMFNYARFHSSGDLVDMDYLKGMCWVARKCPNTKILCFTKKFELVNQFLAEKHKIPKNLVIVFSSWDNFIPENPYNLPMTYVEFKDKSRNTHIPQDSIKCTGSCPKCLGCFHLKKGGSVVFKKH